MPPSAVLEFQSAVAAISATAPVRPGCGTVELNEATVLIVQASETLCRGATKKHEEISLWALGNWGSPSRVPDRTQFPVRVKSLRDKPRIGGGACHRGNQN